MARYLLIKKETETVENTIAWDGITPYDVVDTHYLEQNDTAQIGWTKVNGEWVKPEENYIFI